MHFCRPAVNYKEALGTKSECLSRALINVYQCNLSAHLTNMADTL